MYLIELKNNVAEPFLHNVTNKELKTQVFNAISRNMFVERKKKYVIEAYKESLMTKGLESLRWYANTQIHHRGLIQYMTIKRSKQSLQDTFSKLKQ